MRIAIFGDIHANLEALQAVLADAAEQGCSAHACVGDVVGYNADPVACIEMVRGMDCPVVKGNHDEDAAGDHALENMNPVASAALDWTRQRLGAEDREWLRKLRMVRQVHEFTMVHSTLDQPSIWNYVTNRFEAMSNFSYQFTQVCFHGHTHVPKVYVKSTRVGEIPPDEVVIQQGVKYFINVGSVGQPRDGDWRASYVVYDTDEKRLMFRRVPYEIELTQRKILEAGLPDMLAERLEEGR